MEKEVKPSQKTQVLSETVKELEEDKETENIKKIEAALFLSARFLTLQELVMLTDVNPLMLKELLEKLIEKYNQEGSAIEIISKEKMWKMDVKKEYVGMINKLATGNAEFSKAEQETLAVIAYKQPVKQSVIVKIRGNKAYDHIKHFIDIGLVQAKRLGHTKELRLSDDFYEYFHLQKKEDGKAILDSIEISDEMKEKYEEAEKEVENQENEDTKEELKGQEIKEAKSEETRDEKAGDDIIDIPDDEINDDIKIIGETSEEKIEEPGEEVKEQINDEEKSEEKEGNEEKNLEGV